MIFLYILFLLGWVALFIIIMVWRSRVTVPQNEIHVIKDGEDVNHYSSGDNYIYFSWKHKRSKIPMGPQSLDIPGVVFFDKQGTPVSMEFSCTVENVDLEKTVEHRPVDIGQIRNVVISAIDGTLQSYINTRTIQKAEHEIEKLERMTNNSINDTLEMYGYQLRDLTITRLFNTNKLR